ncbi:hypothetical protein [Fibrisoma limi]|nr:hypothetical protein [Fibrisoma limi]
MEDNVIAKLVSDYLNGKTNRAIQEEYNISPGTMYHYLNKQGVHYKGQPRKYSVDESYFDEIDCESKAYFLGLLFADGCNDTLNFSFKISLQQRDGRILDQFKQALKFTGPILSREPQTNKTPIQGRCVNGGTQHLLRIYSSKLSKRLSELGCVRRKSFVITYPEWLPDSLVCHFLRGYTDGDGCLHLNRKQCKFYLIGSGAFIQSVGLILSRKCNVNVKIINHHSQERIKVLSVSGRNQVRRIVSFLYKDASVYIDRKKHIADAILEPTVINKKRGSERKGTKLSDLDIPKIVQLLGNGYSTRKVAEKFGVANGTIRAIKDRKTWTHITEIHPLP